MRSQLPDELVHMIVPSRSRLHWKVNTTVVTFGLVVLCHVGTGLSASGLVPLECENRGLSTFMSSCATCVGA